VRIVCFYYRNVVTGLDYVSLWFQFFNKPALQFSTRQMEFWNTLYSVTTCSGQWPVRALQAYN
jgi:hypothetical protein